MTCAIVTGRRIKLAVSLGIATIGLLALAACSDSNTKDPADASYDHQNQLLQNPMGDPQMSDPNITGGGFGDYDNKAMMKDLNDVSN